MQLSCIEVLWLGIFIARVSDCRPILVGLWAVELLAPICTWYSPSIIVAL